MLDDSSFWNIISGYSCRFAVRECLISLELLRNLKLKFLTHDSNDLGYIGKPITAAFNVQLRQLVGPQGNAAERYS